ncbi:MAG TPA: tetratricopeptide repeat protein [Polyangiaceae bacterium]|nr:tetratricopeptide repeat protein [Polyangiaceae bacterium]
MAIDREKTLAAAQKYVEKKRYDRAVVEYQRILQEDPNDARTLLKLGDLQSKMEAFAEAIATYERVGKFYSSQGFSLKAIAVYKQIREIIARHVPQLDDKYAHVAPTLANLYQQLGLTSDALAALDEVATRLQRQNRDTDAVDVFRRIVELDPTNPLSHLRLAEALSRIKNVDEAVAEFGTASGQLLRLGRRDDALKVIERILQLSPVASHARIAAELYLARGNSADGMQALAKLQICFQANPRDLDTLGLLARAFTQIGQAVKAIEVQKEMARIARESGKLDLFRELLAKLQKLAPNDDAVKKLAREAAAAPGASSPPSARPAPSEAVEEPAEETYEDVGDSDIESEEHPIDLARRPVASSHNAGAEDTDVDVIEDAAESTASAAREQAARILAEAAGFRRARQLDRAIETLRAGLRVLPKALEVHEMLRDLLLDAGNTREAAAEMIEIAELLVEALDGDEAARSLQDALALDPDNTVATRMLRDLGYELVEETEASDDDIEEIREPSLSARGRLSSYDPEAPLPSYDLEEIGPADVAVRAYSSDDVRRRSGGAHPAAAQAQIDTIDDPFSDAPLPSFPLDGMQEATDATTMPGRSLQRESGTPRAVPELESALEEIDFFASRGLFDDARTILQEQLARLPNHPLLVERLEELDLQERSVPGDSGTRPSPAAAVAQERAVAARLDPETRAERPVGVAPRMSSVDVEQVDVEEVFAKFKAGVAQQIAVEDTQSHYDLGVAYKEMALLDDAIREFAMAARDPKIACVCHSMIGMIQIERGNLNEAIDAFLHGLQVAERTKDQEAALSYEVGAAYEAKKMSKHALDYFQRTARLNASFRDVQERIRRLQKFEPKQPARAVAVGADDEFERAFDDILGQGARGTS